MEAFQNVLGLNASKTREIVSRLTLLDQLERRQKKQYIFRHNLLMLEPLKIVDYYVYVGRRKVYTLVDERIGKGSYSVCYITTNGAHVIKETKITLKETYYYSSSRAWYDSKICELFVSAFIQCVLANDQYTGSYICKPTKLFRDVSLRRSGLRSTLSGEELADTNIYTQLEPVPYKFGKYLKQRKYDLGRRLTLHEIAPLLREIGTVLLHMKERYNCTHGDLHTGNVMVTADGHIKLIDFDFSRMTFEGRKYGCVNDDYRDSYECFDLLVFLTSFLEYEGNSYIDDDAWQFIKGLLDYDGKNMYDTLKSYIYHRTPVFHTAYFDKLEECDVLDIVQGMDILKPENFIEALRGF